VAPAGVEKLTYSSGTIEPCPTTTLSTMRIPHRFHRHVPRRTNIVPRTLQSTYQCFKCPGDTRNGNVGDNTALLIDADNVSYKKLSALMSEVNKDGTASVRRIYGDWTRTPMKIWQHGLMQHSIVPIQQFAYATGKNSTDGAMMVDAMDLLHTNRFSRFCLITSDSDFTRLASRIREQGVSVHGFGSKNVTHQALVAACTKFSYLEDLGATSDETSKESVLVVPRTPVTPASPSTSWGPVFGNSSPASTTQLLPASQTETRFTQDPAISHEKPLDRAAIEAIRSTIIEHQYRADKDCFLNAKYVKQRLVRLSPDLHYRNHGYSKLAGFLMASGIVELKWTDNTMLVRLTDKQNAITTAHNSVPFPPREETAQADPSLPSQSPVKLGRKLHDRIALESIRAAVLEECQDDASSFVDLSGVCVSLRRLSPAMALSDYGYSRLGRFIQASGIVEVEMKGPVPFVRLKDGWRDTISSTAITTTEPLTTSVPLSPPTEVNPAASNAKPLNDPAALEGIRRLIVHLNQGDEDSFVDLENLERNRTSLSPETAAALDYKTRGYPTLLAFIQASGIVELKHTSIATLVRLKHEPIDQAALEAIRTTINNNLWAKNDSFIFFHTFADAYQRLPREVQPRAYGFLRMLNFVSASEIVELKLDGTTMWIRLKDRQRSAITTATTTTEPHTLPPASPSEETSSPPALGSKPIDQVALEGIRTAINNNIWGNKDSFASLDMFANDYVHKQPPDLHYRNYGYSRLHDFLLAAGIVELKTEQGISLIRLKDEQRDAITTTTTESHTPQQASPSEEISTPTMLGRKPLDQAALEGIRQTIISIKSDEDSFVSFDAFASHYFRTLPPEVHPQNYAFSNLREFVSASGIVELKSKDTTMLIRLKSASTTEEVPTLTALHTRSLDQAALEGIRQTILSLRDGENSFVRLVDFNHHYITEQPPALHPKNYGFWRWRPFLRASGIVEFSRDGTTGVIRLRDRHTTSTAATTTTTTTEEAPLLPNPFDSTALKALRTAVTNSPRYRGGSFVKTFDVRRELLRQSPELNPENYGYSRFDVFLLASGLVEMHTVEKRTLVRLWDDYELGPASKAKRDRNMRQMMLRHRGDDKRALLESNVEHDLDGHEHKTSSAYVSWDTGNKCGTRSMMNEDKHKVGKEETPSKSEVKREHEQGRGLDTSFALVALEAGDERKTSLESVRVSHDDQGHKTPLTLLVNGHVAPSEPKKDNGMGQETSLASASPSESDVHEHEHEYERQMPFLKSEDEHKIEHETSSSAPATLHINLNEDAQQGIGMPLTLDIGPIHDDTSTSSLVSKDDEHETSTTSKHEPEHEHNTSLVQKDETQPRLGHEASTSLDSEAEHEPGPEPEPEPEPEVEPEPKPKTTPLASLAQSFSYSERR
jgi:hypothetical protein